MTEAESTIFDLGLRELTVQRLEAYARQNDTTLIEAIDKIVSEWDKWDKFSRSEAFKNPATLNRIQCSVDAVSMKLSDVYNWVSEIKAHYDD